MRTSPVPLPMHRPRLVANITSRAFGTIWGATVLSAFMAFQADSWPWSVVAILAGLTIHAVLAWLYNKDPHIVDIYQQYSRMANVYHPFLADKLPKSFARPFGFGRGVRR